MDGNIVHAEQRQDKGRATGRYGAATIGNHPVLVHCPSLRALLAELLGRQIGVCLGIDYSSAGHSSSPLNATSGSGAEHEFQLGAGCRVLSTTATHLERTSARQFLGSNYSQCASS